MSAEIEFRSGMDVELVDWMGDDSSIVNAARISTVDSSGDNWARLAEDLTSKDAGLINFLMRDRHGTPFESVILQFRVVCPIFVAREVFRHRIASYNETSGRYRELSPVFYIPDSDRPLLQIGKPGAYTFKRGTTEQYELMAEAHKSIAMCAWHDYQAMLEAGVAREVARNVLPLSLYTQFYVTFNLRSLMNFLSLRWNHESSKTPTFPLFEIELIAHQFDSFARSTAPIAMEAFTEFGRVAP